MCNARTLALRFGGALFLFYTKWVERFSRYAYVPLAVLGLLLVFCASVWGLVYAREVTGVLTIAVLDVGQGDSIYIESPTGGQLLIDGGPDEALLRELPKVMPVMDRSIDVVVATHPDADHIAGLIELVKRYDIDAFIEPGINKQTQTAITLRKEVETQAIPRHIGRRDMSIELGGGVQLRILFPNFDVSQIPDNKANEGGVVMELTYGDTEALFMADVSENVERRLLQLDGEQLQSDILKVGHHGSRFSSSDAFISVVRPTVAVISVGKNSYGHPTEATLTILKKYKAKIFRTDESGTIVFQSDGKTFWRAR